MSRLRPLIALALSAIAALLAFAVPAASAHELYAVDLESGSVSVFDTHSGQAIGEPIKVGEFPDAIAVSPDHSQVYVANHKQHTVSVIDTATHKVVGSPINVAEGPRAITFSPDGKRAYVVCGAIVSVIDTATKGTLKPIFVEGGEEDGILSPDGSRLYVVSSTSSAVRTYDTATGTPIGAPVSVGNAPVAVMISTDGSRLYVANRLAESVSVIDTATNQVVGGPIKVGLTPKSFALSPDGSLLYVGQPAAGSVAVIDTATNQVVGAPFQVSSPSGEVVSPDGSRLYVLSNQDEKQGIVTFDTATRQTVGEKITGVGRLPEAIALVPDRNQVPAASPNKAPVASFSVFPTVVRPGVPVSFDGSSSSDPDGSVANYDWSFGDGTSASLGTAKTTHSFRSPGSYRVTLAVRDDEGCSSLNPASSCAVPARETPVATVTVAYPGVRASCPKSSKPRGCVFTLQAVAKKAVKRRGGRPAKPQYVAQSASSKVKLKPGASAIVPLRPKARSAAQLDAATSVLVKQTGSIGKRKLTSVRKLQIVQ